MEDEPQYQGDDPEPLEEEDREQLQQDLVDIQALRALLGSRGIKGTVFYCPDCEEDHYLAWDLLHGNLEAILQNGTPPVHEPAFSPDPDEYVSWDYARGFLDGYESLEDEETAEVAMRVAMQLRDRGWRKEDVRSLLSASGLGVPPAVERGWDDPR